MFPGCTMFQIHRSNIVPLAAESNPQFHLGSKSLKGTGKDHQFRVCPAEMYDTFFKKLQFNKRCNI
ncbi:hypothetical protein HanXRQr2_Chr16g0761671 [Helianthus annuus]|uniref:Uncharacterized protein n=1 Tax=Helianthus annuus TaxID=4232 RepID=A0A9K3DTE8_HELAN|nr:hypothetical protein HanXRQr2_Chr16g0761671 [Helianthus annuus]